MRESWKLGVCAGVLMCPAMARATYFSFASGGIPGAHFTSAGVEQGENGAPDFFRLNSNANALTYSPVNLLIDDDNMPLPAWSVPAKLYSDFTVTHAASTPVVGSTVQHTYHLTGSFQFRHVTTDELLLRCDVAASTNSNFMGVIGTSSLWASSGALIGGDVGGVENVRYTATQALVNALGGSASAAGYGIVIAPGAQTVESGGIDDFAFDLTLLAPPVSPPPLVPLAGSMPATAFTAQMSFSGSSTEIPGPVTASMAIAAGAWKLLRRNRVPRACAAKSPA